jgi:hypothetical protein
MVGLFGKPEEMLRQKNKLPEFSEYGDYYIDRQLANMVADRVITSEDAKTAMIEKNGPAYEEAKKRVKLELAMRVPGMAAVYAATHDGALAGMAATVPSLFGAGILPTGELEYRNLKGEWTAAWKMADAGDKDAVNLFFEKHPEYEAYLMKGKTPDEKLRSALIGNIWDGYMSLGPTDRKAATAALGPEFQKSFLDKETRAYDAISEQQLNTWAQMLGATTYKTEATPQIEPPAAPVVPAYTKEVTAITDQYFKERQEKYADHYFLEQGYYSLPKSQRAAYLRKFPRLKEYWDYKKKYFKMYPELVPILKGDVFDRVDTTAWPPALLEYVQTYAYTGKHMPKGARAALEQQWIKAGMPYGSLDTWLNSQVVPSMLYTP